MKFPWIIIRRRRLEVLEDDLLQARALISGLRAALGRTQAWLERAQSLAKEHRRVIDFYRNGR